jgi:hypothetical protein
VSAIIMPCTAQVVTAPLETGRDTRLHPYQHECTFCLPGSLLHTDDFFTLSHPPPYP